MVGVVNITVDSFSDGGRYLGGDAALAHASELLAAGADLVELGPASSHPDAAAVSPEEEIERIAAVLDALVERRVEVAIDSCLPSTQLYALEHGAAMLNDIKGFADSEVYDQIARGKCRLVVMFSVQARERADRRATDARAVVGDMLEFFEARIAALESAGVARERLIVDPGMGFFLGASPEPSLLALRSLAELKRRFGLPVMVSVSRKSFLGSITGRAVSELGAATLAAELYAVAQGVDYVRTHDVAALRDALRVRDALEGVGPLVA